MSTSNVRIQSPASLDIHAQTVTRLSQSEECQKSSQPVVTVCIVNWNCKNLLDRCLRSLSRNRQGVNLEIIVVDNGSTDGAPDLVRSNHPKVHLICNEKNQGFARANNQAIRLAKGRYLFFLNNDTEVPKRAVSRLVRFARKNPEIGIIGPRLKDMRGRTQTSCRQRPTVSSLLHRTILFRWSGLFRKSYREFRWRDQDFTTSREVQVLMGAALFMKRQLLLEEGSWDEGYRFGGEDIELCTRIGKTKPIVYHPLISILHHGRASSKQLSGYVYLNWLLGMLRFLRQSGENPLHLLFFKLVITLNLPLELMRHLVQAGWRRLMGNKCSARRSWISFRAHGYLLTQGMVAFWLG